MTNKGNKKTMTAEEKRARNEKRLATMRANLDALEMRAECILSKNAEDITSADRNTLLMLLNVAYHDSGKIEGITSIDGSSSCDFCAKMRNTGNPLCICNGCYAWADKWKEAAFRRHILNMRILSSVLFEKEELAALHIDTIKSHIKEYAFALLVSALLRINEDGDINNIIHARNVLRIIETHKDAGTGFWAKNTADVSAALHAEGVHTKAEKRAKYGNARFVQSSVLIGIPARPVWYADAVFTVYPDAETIAEAIKNGAFPCNGRKCMECGFNCYNPENNTDDVQYIAEYLRCTDAERKAYVEAYKALVSKLSNK